MKARLLFFFLFYSYVSFSQLVVNFSSDKNLGCGRTAIRFDASTSSGYSSFLWNFGNGQSNNDELRPLVMFDPGNYTVTFTVNDGSASLQKTMDIIIHKAPTGSIIFVSERKGCIGETISFKASATPGDAPISLYKWIHGDGDKSTGTSGTHQYKYANVSPGYPLVLEITDDNNCSYKTFEYIPISGKPNITIVPNSFYTCDSTSVYLGSEVISDASIQTYKWNFGDNTTDAKAIPGLHKYNAFGKYKVSLEATDINGCKNVEDTTLVIYNVKASIDVPDSVCYGDSVLLKNVKSDATVFKWVINNSDTIRSESFKIAPSAVDSLNIQLFASNKYCMVKDTALVRVSSIFAKFKMDTSWVCKFPYEVGFTDKTAGNVKNYLWDFGDGKISTDKNPKHTFAKPSAIKLTVTSNAGCVSIDSSKLLLKRPLPVIILSDSGGCLPLNVILIGDSSKAISTITNYSWKVKGWTWDSPNPKAVSSYTQPVIDTIKLTITDQICGNETAKFVFKAGTKPIVDFQSADIFGITETNNAINLSEPGDSIDFNKWIWNGNELEQKDFDWMPYEDTAYFDGQTSSYIKRNYFPLPKDEIDIKLVTGFYTCFDSISKAVTMQGPVAEIVDVYKTSCLLPTEINFSYKIYDAYKLEYFFENLSGGPGLTNSIVYLKDTTASYTITVTLNPGFYKLHITAYNLATNKSHNITYHEWNCASGTDGPGCTKTDKIIPVSNIVKANFTLNDTVACWNSLVQFDASTSQNAVLHEWYKSQYGLKPELMYPYFSPSLTKDEPLICLANPVLCSLSDMYSENPYQPCPIDTNFVVTDSSKTYAALCNRGLYDIMLVSTATNGCTDTMTSKNIIRVIKPEATLTSDNPRVCKGEEITFSLQNIIEDKIIKSYVLNFGDESSYKLTNSSELTKKSYTDGVYLPYLTLRDTLGCENTVLHKTYKGGTWKANIVVTSNPEASISTDGISCLNHNLLVSCNERFASYKWNFGDGNVEVGSNNYINHNYSKAGSYNFWLVAEDSIACTDTVYQTMKVLPEPVFNISVDTPYWGCPIAILSIEDISGNENIISRTWTMENSSVSTEMPIIASASSIIIMPVIYPGVYNVSLEINSEYCGIFNSSFDNIFRLNGPFMKMVQLKDKYCRMDSLLFTPDSTTLYNNPVFLQWIFDNKDNGKTLYSDQLLTKRTFDMDGNYRATLFYTDTLGCEMYDTSLYYINKLKADFNFSEPICDIPKPFELVNQSNDYDSLVWKMGTKLSHETNYSDTIFNFGSYPITLEVYDTTGCMDSKRLILKASARPRGITNQLDTIMCQGDTIQLRTYFDPVYSYNWIPQFNMENSNVFNPLIFPEENTTYSLKITDTVSMCTTEDTLKVYVQSIPDITYEYVYLPYTSENVFSLANSNIIRVPLGDSIRFIVNTDQYAVKYLWENSDNLLNCVNCQNPVARVMKHSMIKVIPDDSLGCYSKLLTREFELIPVDGQLLMPTAFSPNGDQINDVLKLEGPGLEELIYLRIYNFSGAQIFETTKLTEGWDGMYNGKPQPAGIYFYKVKAKIINDSKEYEIEGAIKLVR